MKRFPAGSRASSQCHSRDYFIRSIIGITERNKEFSRRLYLFSCKHRGPWHKQSSYLACSMWVNLPSSFRLGVSQSASDPLINWHLLPARYSNWNWNVNTHSAPSRSRRAARERLQRGGSNTKMRKQLIQRFHEKTFPEFLPVPCLTEPSLSKWKMISWQEWDELHVRFTCHGFTPLYAKYEHTN